MNCAAIPKLTLALMTRGFGLGAAATEFQSRPTRKAIPPTPQASANDTIDLQHDPPVVLEEQHQVLAMAFQQNLAIFTGTLLGSLVDAGSANIEFVRAVVVELRRSFDQLELHHRAHKLTMSHGTSIRLSGMMQPMDAHLAALNTLLVELEREVQLSVPRVKQIATLAGAMDAHLEAMTQTQHAALGSRTVGARF